MPMPTNVTFIACQNQSLAGFVVDGGQGSVRAAYA
jgi:hypothetical protein